MCGMLSRSFDCGQGWSSAKLEQPKLAWPSSVCLSASSSSIHGLFLQMSCPVSLYFPAINYLPEWTTQQLPEPKISCGVNASNHPGPVRLAKLFLTLTLLPGGQVPSSTSLPDQMLCTWRNQGLTITFRILSINAASIYNWLCGLNVVKINTWNIKFLSAIYY